MIRGAVKSVIALTIVGIATFAPLLASINDRTGFECHRVPIQGDQFKGTAKWGMACGAPYVYHPLPSSPADFVYTSTPGGRASD